jgi:hypothetical protein
MSVYSPLCLFSDGSLVGSGCTQASILAAWRQEEMPSRRFDEFPMWWHQRKWRRPHVCCHHKPIREGEKHASVQHSRERDETIERQCAMSMSMG